MKTTHTVKVTDLSTMEWETWEHIMAAARGPHNAVNAQYAIAFAIMSVSDTMATNCKALNRATAALESISETLANMESDGVAHLKMALNAVAQAISSEE